MHVKWGSRVNRYFKKKCMHGALKGLLYSNTTDVFVGSTKASFCLSFTSSECTLFILDNKIFRLFFFTSILENFRNRRRRNNDIFSLKKNHQPNYAVLIFFLI